MNGVIKSHRFILFDSGFNHFQSMPVLPGDSQPLSLTAGGKGARKGGRSGSGKARKGGNSVKNGDDAEEPSTPKQNQQNQGRKRKGDEELLQLDLKRQQLQIRRSPEPRVLFH